MYSTKIMLINNINNAWNIFFFENYSYEKKVLFVWRIPIYPVFIAKLVSNILQTIQH